MKYVKRAAIAFVVAATAFFVVGGTAFAQDAPPPVHADTTDTSTLVLAAPLVTIIVSLLIPLVNGLITKTTTNAGVKAIITIVLNAVSALITTGLLADGTAAFSSTTLFTWLVGTIISIASYVGLWKPMTLTSNQGGRLANVGVKSP